MKNRLLQEASDLYSKREATNVAPCESIAAPAKPPLPSAALRPVQSARRIITPKQALMCSDDDENFKDITFLTNSQVT